MSVHPGCSHIWTGSVLLWRLKAVTSLPSLSARCVRVCNTTVSGGVWWVEEPEPPADSTDNQIELRESYEGNTITVSFMLHFQTVNGTGIERNPAQLKCLRLYWSATGLSQLKLSCEISSRLSKFTWKRKWRGLFCKIVVHCLFNPAYLKLWSYSFSCGTVLLQTFEHTLKPHPAAVMWCPRDRYMRERASLIFITLHFKLEA